MVQIKMETKSFMLCTPHQMSSLEDWDGQDMWHVGGGE
jgi:hypothetical protein